MNNVVIENDKLRIKILKKGAEISSVVSKKDNTEYIWQADPDVWGRHAPLLFPIVGKLKDDRYEYADNIFHMSQHGFARDMAFKVEEQKKDSVRFSLKYTEETLQKFPFHFVLEVEYHLEENHLVTKYSVTNLDVAKEMYFSIGAHPGFKVPLEAGTTFEDYFIEITPQATRNILPVSKDVLIEMEKMSKTNQNKFELNRELFKDGVLIMETAGETVVTLASHKTDKKITFTYNNMPYLGLWSIYPTEGEFVCIEPWCGIADTSDTSGNFKEKKGIIVLDPEMVFDVDYHIIFA
jgi:galactose mutarotase-like enzyme